VGKILFGDGAERTGGGGVTGGGRRTQMVEGVRGPDAEGGEQKVKSGQKD